MSRLSLSSRLVLAMAILALALSLPGWISDARNSTAAGGAAQSQGHNAQPAASATVRLSELGTAEAPVSTSADLTPEVTASTEVPSSTASPPPTGPISAPIQAGISPASPPTTGGGSSSLASLLATLTVAQENRPGYDRSLFPLWIDADHDGCDTRREVLIAESLAPVSVGSSCSISGGRWRSLYDGIETTDPSTFDIDHVVPLAETWDSGASAWTTDRRTRFANDLDVEWTLIAVSASSNRSKSDQDPAEWLPPLAGVRCTYVSMWIAVKVRWALAIDPVEKGALESDIGGCEEQLTVPLAPR